MKAITGSHLYSSTGDDIGEITDVLGGVDEEEDGPTWVSVKTGLFSHRLVPYSLVEDRDGRLTTALDAGEVKSAPKVPAHVEPAGTDLEALQAHYAQED